MWIELLLAFILVIAIIAVSLKSPRIYWWFLRLMTALRAVLKGNKNVDTKDYQDLNKTIESAGYAYDEKQDIFYSIMDPWQRSLGYCRLYDEAASPLGMIIDCEPIYFEYGGKSWMIELWKGQYDLTTGCEIGIYTTEDPDNKIPGIGTFYQCASNADRLKMSYTLIKNGEILFTREGKHWWLTGFKLGEFSEPSELDMNARITLKDKSMCNAFVKGLKGAGYAEDKFEIKGNTVSLHLAEPLTKQPITRIPATDWIMQRKNKFLCDKYQEITGPYSNLPDKIKAIQENAPELYDMIVHIGKKKHLFEMYEIIRSYLN
jgi:hypothetical protein